MDINYTKDIVMRAFLSDPQTKNIEFIDNLIVIQFKDDTLCSLDIQSPLLLYQNHNEIPPDISQQYVKNYYDTHTEEDFIQDVLYMKKTRPGAFYAFLILKKFMELGIISRDMLNLILSNVNGKEAELDEFFISLESSR